jgi:ribosome maturation factor RimP
MEIDRIREAAERVAHSLGLEVVDIEWKVGKDRLLRVFIDKPEGVSHNDCQAVSEQLSVILDVEELIHGSRYVLEISSPGLDRKLFKPADYERFVGRLAKIWLTDAIAPWDGARPVNYIEGRLHGFAEGRVRVDPGKGMIEVPLQSIRKANLVVEF